MSMTLLIFIVLCVLTILFVIAGLTHPSDLSSVTGGIATFVLVVGFLYLVSMAIAMFIRVWQVSG